MSGYIDWSVLRNVVVVATVFAIGVVALFSVAVRALVTADEHPERPATGQRLIAAGCLLVTLAAVAIGLWAVLAK